MIPCLATCFTSESSICKVGALSAVYRTSHSLGALSWAVDSEFIPEIHCSSSVSNFSIPGKFLEGLLIPVKKLNKDQVGGLIFIFITIN